jgi:integrase
MLAAGVPLKVVSDRLGHSSIAITADTYSHVSVEVDRAAADQIAVAVNLA